MVLSAIALLLSLAGISAVLSFTGARLTREIGILTQSALSLSQWAVLVAYAALMLVVCLLACIVPSHRALRVEPTEALRAE